MPETTDVGSQAASLVQDETGQIQPILRWAGGKRWLVPEVLRLIGGPTVARYHEPFLGGGAIFFALRVSEQAYLSDLNTDLIEVYREVRDRPAEVAELLGSYSNTADDYYETRAVIPGSAVERAARFIFLNHTSYNGIHRVNLRGEYNVPYGNRNHVNMPDDVWLRKASTRLAGTELNSGDFERALGDVQPGDLVFLDPPYTVAHNNNGFVKYNQHLFSFEDQIKLAEQIKRIDGLGAKFILTNAAHASIDELFSALGTKLTVSRRNAIGGLQAARGRAEESVFTNIGVQ